MDEINRDLAGTRKGKQDTAWPAAIFGKMMGPNHGPLDDTPELWPCIIRTHNKISLATGGF